MLQQSGKPWKLLIVEDNIVDSKFLVDLLHGSDYGSEAKADIKCADSFHVSEGLLKAEYFDAILLDLNLPDTKGLDTLNKVKNVRPDIPIVVISGEYNERVGAQMIAAGAQDYFIKGNYDAQLLHRSVGYAIERKKRETEKSRRDVEMARAIKELRCLYDIYNLAGSQNVSMGGLIQGITNIISTIWCASDVSCVTISYQGKEYRCKTCRKTKWCQFSDIKVHGKDSGVLEVYFMSDRLADSDNMRSCSPERDWVNFISREIGPVIERKLWQENLIASENALKVKNKELQDRSGVLKEILSEVEKEKEEISGKLYNSIQGSLMPILNGIGRSKGILNDKKIMSLKKDLESIVSVFDQNFSFMNVRLTPREQEICDMLKNGMNSGNISEVLRITSGEVDAYCVKIRKKLGIQNKHIHLASFLKSIF
ncbi:MAG TPA: response regulator transcription factor [Candidatus Omnitrophota bacterium]|nr:response regulator transcription factor [Candidatus Omnitrophota bacterium]